MRRFFGFGVWREDACNIGTRLLVYRSQLDWTKKKYIKASKELDWY